MKIHIRDLKRLIKEEYSSMMNEADDLNSATMKAFNILTAEEEVYNKAVSCSDEDQLIDLFFHHITLTDIDIEDGQTEQIDWGKLLSVIQREDGSQRHDKERMPTGSGSLNEDEEMDYPTEKAFDLLTQVEYNDHTARSSRDVEELKQAFYGTFAAYEMDDEEIDQINWEKLFEKIQARNDERGTDELGHGLVDSEFGWTGTNVPGGTRPLNENEDPITDNEPFNGYRNWATYSIADLFQNNMAAYNQIENYTEPEELKNLYHVMYKGHLANDEIHNVDWANALEGINGKGVTVGHGRGTRHFDMDKSPSGTKQQVDEVEFGGSEDKGDEWYQKDNPKPRFQMQGSSLRESIKNDKVLSEEINRMKSLMR